MTNDDYASEREEQHRAWAMKHRKHAGPRPTGFCHYCEDPVGQGAQFCPGGDCRRDWETEQRAKIQNQGRYEE